MNHKLLAITLLMLSGVSFAEEISGPPPVGLLLLQYKKIFDGDPQEGAHGLKEYCYKLNTIYVVYSQNLLGEGYAFLSARPDQQCIVSKNRISTKNKLGLTIGVSKGQASQLLGIDLLEGHNKIIWQYQRPIHNLTYDDMTTLNVTIKKGVVYAVSLFNTVTN